MSTMEDPDNAAGAIQFAAKKGDVEPEVPVEYFCGIGSFKPKCLQVCRTAKFFTFLLCCNCFVEGALATGFVAVVLSSLERRYQLTSTQAGLIVSVFDIAVIVSVIFISYFAGKGHKPRWLGVSLLIQGLGAFIFALPQFVFGNYAVGPSATNRLESCDDGIDFSPDCEITGRNQYSLIFFYIGNILSGIGAAPLFTVAPSYIDDIVWPKFVSIHLGVFLMWSILGPALGFALGSAFLSIYVDFWEETELEPSDPGWVGAWWLCFLFSAVASWLLAIPFLMFPKLLPDSHLVKAEREKEMAQKYSVKGGDISAENKNFLAKLTYFPRHLLQVLTTPSWICITVGVCFTAFVVEGLVAFAPKLYETQFSLSASVASLATGGSAIPTGAVGVLVGAIVIRRLNGRAVAMVNWILTLIAIPPLLIFFIRCPTLQLAGVNVPFADGSVVEDRTGPTISSCNLNCSCTSSIFEPVCGSDDLTYFSPCRAGCDKAFINNDRQNPIFKNCSCIAANLLLANNRSVEFEEFLSTSTATEGVCDNGCVGLGAFLGLSLVALFLLFILEVPNIVITMRCVADEQRSLALGVQSFLFRTLGNVPGPIVFGAVYDAACIFFRYDVPCMDRGNCWVYDNYQLSWSIVIIVLVGVFCNFIFSFLTWVTYPKQNGSDTESSANRTAMELATTNDVPPTADTSEDRPKFEAVNSQTILIPNSD